MHPVRLIASSTRVCAGLALLAAAFAVACASKDPAAPYTDTQGVDGLGGAATVDDDDDVVPEPTGPVTPVVFDIVDMDESPCEPIYGGAAKVEDPQSGRPVVRRLIAGWGGWVAENSYESGFLRLTHDGTGVKQDKLQLGSLDRITTLGKDLLVVSTDATGVIAARYGGSDKLDTPASLGEGTAFELATGSTGELALAVWADYTAVRARLIDEDGPRGEVIELLSGVPTDSFHAAVAPVGESLIAAWTARRVSDGIFVTRVVKVDGDGSAGPVRILYESQWAQAVVDVAATDDGANVLIADNGSPLIAPLDMMGVPAGNAVRYGDAVASYALEGSASGMLLGVRLADGRDAVRSLGNDGKPVGSWQCLHAAASSDEHAVALGHDDASFGVLYRNELGENRFLTVAAP
jgi:hypothetical protein